MAADESPGLPGSSSGAETPTATEGRRPKRLFFLDPVIVLELLCIVAQTYCVSMVIQKLSNVHKIVWIFPGIVVLALILLGISLTHRSQGRIPLGVLNVISSLVLGGLMLFLNFLSRMA